ncbi:hypothetical protein KPH14_008270 [Odynerus spinipes]|uniref:Uncharacterized protein n=1 Tax=Odynerus spinipes TaxID=1348599 RepID=A0AAD9VLT6_9HYME|nr:hypothetical protein KPH14_008270 [Odynerus spinipes]
MLRLRDERAFFDSREISGQRDVAGIELAAPGTGNEVENDVIAFSAVHSTPGDKVGHRADLPPQPRLTFDSPGIQVLEKDKLRWGKERVALLYEDRDGDLLLMLTRCRCWVNGLIDVTTPELGHHRIPVHTTCIAHPLYQ